MAESLGNPNRSHVWFFTKYMLTSNRGQVYFGYD